MQNIFKLVGKIQLIKSIVGLSGVGKVWDGKNILCVAGDLGGWHAAAVVLKQLADSGANISVAFTGPSRRAFEEHNLEIDSRFKILNNGQALVVIASHRQSEAKQSHAVSLIIVAPSQSKDGNNDTVKIINGINGSVPIFVIEDMWGSAVPFLKKIEPRLLKKVSVSVVDQFAKKVVVKSTGIKARNIYVTGGPQFDRVLELKKRLG